MNEGESIEESAVHDKMPSRKQSLSEETRSEYRDAFRIFDRKGQNRIGTEELDQMIRSLGHDLTESELSHMIKDADKNDTGFVEFEDLCALMESRQAEDEQTQLREAFDFFDTNNDGFIEASELVETLASLAGKDGSPLTLEEAESMIKEADLDEDGKVTFEDYVRLFSHSQ